MNTSERLCSTVAASLSLFAAGCMGSPPSIERVTHRVPVTIDLSGPRPQRLQLRLQQGHVLVRPGSELRGELFVEIPAPTTAEAERLAGALHLSPQGDDQHTRLIAVEPLVGLALADVHCDFRLTVPPDVELRIDAVHGDVTLREFTGRVRIHTVGGRIRADLRGGDIAVHSEAGHTSVSGLYDTAHLVTDRGQVVLTVPESPLAPDAVRLESGSGNLRLRASPEDPLGLVFETDSGLVVSDVPIRWVERHETPGQRRVRLVGRLGRTIEAAPDLEVFVQSRTGDLELVRLRDGIAAAMR